MLWKYTLRTQKQNASSKTPKNKEDESANSSGDEDESKDWSPDEGESIDPSWNEDENTDSSGEEDESADDAESKRTEKPSDHGDAKKIFFILVSVFLLKPI